MTRETGNDPLRATPHSPLPTPVTLDRPSLLAGKLHALLQRTWTKGRDLFDLFWYLSDPTWPHPNLVLVNNALRQTGWQMPPLDESTWRPVARDRVESLREGHLVAVAASAVKRETRRPRPSVGSRPAD